MNIGPVSDQQFSHFKRWRSEKGGMLISILDIDVDTFGKEAFNLLDISGLSCMMKRTRPGSG